jgi:hypothetical protein
MRQKLVLPHKSFRLRIKLNWRCVVSRPILRVGLARDLHGFGDYLALRSLLALNGVFNGKDMLAAQLPTFEVWPTTLGIDGISINGVPGTATNGPAKLSRLCNTLKRLLPTSIDQES